MLSTLGYGDFTPLTRLAQMLAFSEALVGQFYLAVLGGEAGWSLQ